jgi:hypothetical protein
MITDAARLLRIADRLGIEVVENAKSQDIPVSLGPQGHACCPRRRRVYVHELMSDGSDPLSRPAHVAYVFHELMHVYLQPPWWQISEVPEEMLLLPVERSMARAQFDREVYREVINYQEMTTTWVSGGVDELGTTGYRNTTWWRRGFQLARVLGVLTDRGRPTYTQPVWERIAGVRRKVRAYFADPYEAAWPLL